MVILKERFQPIALALMPGWDPPGAMPYLLLL
jgi:hypothetical protein